MKITSELIPSSKAEAYCVFVARLKFRDKRQDVTIEKSKGLGPTALLRTRLMILSKSFNPLDSILSFYYSSLQQTKELVIITILQMWKLRHTEVKWHAQVDMTTKR